MFMLLRPYWLLALMVFIIVIWQLYKKQIGTSKWEEICDPHLMKYLLVGFGQTKKTPMILLMIFLFILIIALAGPSFKEEKTPIYRTGQTIVVLLDLSYEMLVEDISPNRLVRAKYKIEDLFKKKTDYRYALVVFSEEPFTVSPVTDDAATILEMIPGLSPDLMPVAGKNIAKALNYAKTLIQRSGNVNGNILLFTTGDSNVEAENIAAQLKKENIILSVIGVGSYQGAPIPTPTGFMQDKKTNITMSKLDPISLKKLAKAGGGIFQELTPDDLDLNVIIKKWNLVEQQSKNNYIVNVRSDDGYWLLFILVGIVLWAFRSGWFYTIVN